MITKNIFVLLVLTAYWIPFDTAFAHPYFLPVYESSLLGAALSNRTSQQPYFTPGVILLTSFITYAKCIGKTGCREGRCWSHCGFNLFSKKWCYTTKPDFKVNEYVDCKNDSDCSSCWSCADQCGSSR